MVKQYEEESLGTLKAADRTTISSRILAGIDEISSIPMTRWKKGQMLIRLQQDDLRAQLSQAQESLMAARCTYHYAGRDFRLTDVHGRVVNEIDS